MTVDELTDQEVRILAFVALNDSYPDALQVQASKAMKDVPARRLGAIVQQRWRGMP